MALTRPRASQIYDIDYKQATRVVTVANITLAGGAPSQVDGVNLSLKDRVLVTGQSTLSQNGIYFVSVLGSGSNGTWTRSLDTDTTGEILTGTIVMVTEGNIYADTQWKLITDGIITVGVTDQVWTQNYSANSISSGNSNVIVNSNANVTVSSAGTANVLVVSSTGIVVSGTESVTGNATVGNLLTGGIISATGNITGDYFLGNVFYANGITASKIYSGNSEVNVTTSGGNVNVSVGGTSNVAVFSTAGEYVTGLLSVTGDVTSGNVLTGGLISATGNLTSGNVNTVIVSATGQIVTTAAGNLDTGAGQIYLNGASENRIDWNTNGIGAPTFTTRSAGTKLDLYPALGASSTDYALGVEAGALWLGIPGNDAGQYIKFYGGTTEVANISGTGVMSVSGNVTGANLLTAGQVSATSNVTAGNILTAGLVSATGNITTAGYFLGNVACASGIYASRIFNGTSEANIAAANANLAISINGTSNVAVFATTGEYVTGLVSASGNITGANLLTGGIVSATGNITAGNLTINNDAIISGNLSVVGNATLSGNILGDRIINGNTSIEIQTASGNANISVGGTSNVVVFTPDGEYVTGVVSASGNILTSGNISATGNITGGNILGNGAGLSGINAFSTVAVATQDSVIANTISSTLTIAAGNNITLTTSNTTNTLTIAYSGSSGSSIFATGGDMGLVTDSVTASEDLGTVDDAVSISYDLGQLGVDGVVSNSDIIANTITGDKINSATSISITGNLTAANLSLTSSSGDVLNWWYSGNSVSVSSQATAPTGLVLDNTFGTYMYVTNTSTSSIYQYTLSTGFNVSTATYASLSTSVVAQDATPQDLQISNTGEVLWLLGGANASVYQYTLTAGNIATATYDSKTLSVSAKEPTPTGLAFQDTLGNCYVVGNTNNTIYRYRMTEAGNIATASYTSELSISSYITDARSIAFNADGTLCWIANGANKHIYQFTLADAWDITTGSYTGKNYVGDQESVPTGLHVNPTAGYAYVTGPTPAGVFQYGITNGTIATANSLYLSTTSLYIGGNTFSTGNVTAGNLVATGYVYGNGSQLTGISSGNACVSITTTDITANFTIGNGTNGFSVGPMNTANGVSVITTPGQRWIII